MQKPQYIYSIGKPDLGAGSIDRTHAAGYKAGLLLDISITRPKSADRYDRIELVDFEHLDTEIARLEHEDLSVAGLLCTYENYLIAKAKLGAFFEVPTISIESAKMSTDKFLMRRAFHAANPDLSPKFALISTKEELAQFMQTATYPVILKPTNLVKSLLVIKCDTPGSLQTNFAYALKTIGSLYAKYHVYDRTPQLIVEEFITGQMYSVAAYVDTQGTAHFCPGFVKLTTAQQIGIDDNFLYKRELPCDLDAGLTSQLHTAAAQGISALNMTSSPAHVELIANENGVKIIEIGARTGGYRPRMYDVTYGVDLLQAELDLALGNTPMTSGDLVRHTAVYELFPDTTGTFHALEPSAPQDLYYQSIKARVGETVGPASEGFKATAVLIVSAANIDEFRKKCAMVEQMKVVVQ